MQVAIAAPSGWLGGHIARGFVAHPSYTTRLLAHEVHSHNVVFCLLKGLFFRPVQLTDKEGKDKFEALKKDGATVVQVDYKNADNLVKALEGVEILVSAIGGNGVLV